MIDKVCVGLVAALCLPGKSSLDVGAVRYRLPRFVDRSHQWAQIAISVLKPPRREPYLGSADPKSQHLTKRRSKGSISSGIVLLVLLLLVALGSRFVFIDADFPIYLTFSGAPLTDEGWYSNAAVRQVLFDNWHVDGDVNEAAVQPAFHLLQFLTFRIIGVGLVQARITAAILFCTLVVLMCSICGGLKYRWGAFFAAFLLATNFHLFAYSRIALVEIPMMFFFVLAGWLVISKLELPLWRVILAAAVLTCAILTKPAAVFGVPAILSPILLESKPIRVRFIHASVFLTILILALAAFHSTSWKYFPDDWNLYWADLGSQWGTRSSSWIDGAWEPLKGVARRQPILVATFVVASFVLVTHRTNLARRSLSALMVFTVAIGTYYFLLAQTGYLPTRYFIPIFILLIGFVSCAFGVAWSCGPGRLTKLLAVMGVLCLVTETTQILGYLASPVWSYRDFCQDLQSDLADYGASALLMGNLAPQITLVTGIASISGEAGSKPPEWRFRRYRPTHMVIEGGVENTSLSPLSLGYSVGYVRTYEIMGNRRGPIRLYQVQLTGAVGAKN